MIAVAPTAGVHRSWFLMTGKMPPRRIRDSHRAADKSPYKTNAACWFHHRRASNGDL
jgi:hypothetical protein